MKAKLEMLKELLGQMQSLIADGEGEDQKAGADAMEELGEAVEAEPKVAEGVEEEAAPEDEEDDVREAAKAFMRPKRMAPKKSAVVMFGKAGIADAKRGPKKPFPKKAG